MSVEAFSGLLGRCDVSPTGKRWFPVWGGRYASHLSKSAWQRFQAVQSIDAIATWCIASRALP